MLLHVYGTHIAVPHAWRSCLHAMCSSALLVHMLLLSSSAVMLVLSLACSLPACVIVISA